MQFLNEEVDVQRIPAAENVTLTPIDGAYLKVLRWGWFITVFILLVIATLLIWFVKPLHQPAGIIIVSGTWLVIALVSWLLQLKSFQKKAYAIRDKDVIYRSGWIFQHTDTCPFNRVQHSVVTIGPIEKRYGLASLVFFTAGSYGSHLRIPGLTEANAQALKEYITKKINHEPAE